MKEVEESLGFQKVNTTAYHPQTDGLVERFNLTFINMIVRTVECEGRLGPASATCYFCLLYMPAAKHPEVTLLLAVQERPTSSHRPPSIHQMLVGLQQYGAQHTTHLAGTWETARKAVKKAQSKQTTTTTGRVHHPTLQLEKEGISFKPAEKTGEGCKFARPYILWAFPGVGAGNPRSQDSLSRQATAGACPGSSGLTTLVPTLIVRRFQATKMSQMRGGIREQLVANHQSLSVSSQMLATKKDSRTYQLTKGH